MTRSVDDLAVTLRDAIPELYEVMPLTDANPFAALSELVALAKRADEAEALADTLQRDGLIDLTGTARKLRAAEMALADMRRVLDRIAGQDCERFTDADPRECVETKREPCDRCVALAALIAEENRALAAAGPAPEETT